MTKRIFLIPSLHSIKIGKEYRIQFYTPEIGAYNNDFYVRLDTALRIALRDDWKGFGLCLLGFGLGFDYQQPEKVGLDNKEI